MVNKDSSFGNVLACTIIHLKPNHFNERIIEEEKREINIHEYDLSFEG